MHFKQIELHNFGLYKGVHVLDLSVKKDNKNIILIGGMNGRGKTTILEAIFVAFYGNRAMQAIQDKKVTTYSKMLASRFNKSSIDNLASVEVTIVLEEKSNKEIRIKRYWKKPVKGKNTVDNLEVFVNGVKDDVLAENWNFYVEEILPLSIARFFFFDNEKISSIAEDESFEQIKSSIKSIMGISLIDTLENDIRKIIKVKTGQLSVNENIELKKEYSLLIKEIDRLKERRDNYLKSEKSLGNEIKALSTLIDEQEESFWQEGGNLGVKRDAVKEEKEKLNLRRAEIQNKIQSMTVDAGVPLILCENLVRDALKRSEKCEEILARQYSVGIVRDLRVKLYNRIFLSFSDNCMRDKILELIEEEFTKFDEYGNESDQFIMSAVSISLLKKLENSEFENIKSVCEELLSEIERVEEDILRVDMHLSNDVNQEAIKDLYKELKKYQETRTAKESELKMIQKEINETEKRINDLQKNANNLLGRLAEIEKGEIDVGRVLQYASKTLTVMEKFKIELQRQKVNNLEMNITKCFMYLEGKHNMISEIKINPDTLDIVLLDSKRNELLKSQLSAGEKQIFAVSVLWGLALSSGYQMPVVIDTPMARLDSAHRINFVSKYLPNASSQVIVLSTDEEIYGEYLGMLRPYVHTFYTLSYDDNEECTTITDGYFGRMICS